MPDPGTESLLEIISSSHDVLHATGNVVDGRLTKFDQTFVQQYYDYCKETEQKQPGGERLRVVDRDRGQFSQGLELKADSTASAITIDRLDAKKMRVELGGTSYDAYNVLAGLWSKGVFGQQFGHGDRHTSDDIAIPYLHRPANGRSESVTKLVIRSADAPLLAHTLEAVIFKSPAR